MLLALLTSVSELLSDHHFKRTYCTIKHYLDRIILNPDYNRCIFHYVVDLFGLAGAIVLLSVGQVLLFHGSLWLVVILL